MWVQGNNHEIKLGWQQTVAPGDAFVEQTSNFWIFFMIACLFGRSDFIFIFGSNLSPLSVGRNGVFWPFRYFADVSAPKWHRPWPPNIPPEANLGCRRTASSVAASPPWRGTSAAWISQRRVTVPMPTSRATCRDARRPMETHIETHGDPHGPRPSGSQWQKFQWNVL